MYLECNDIKVGMQDRAPTRLPQKDYLSECNHNTEVYTKLKVHKFSSVQFHL